jgi:hypothetical protein
MRAGAAHQKSYPHNRRWPPVLLRDLAFGVWRAREAA